VGEPDGDTEGRLEGAVVGSAEGLAVGNEDGDFVGRREGALDGDLVGRREGALVGAEVGGAAATKGGVDPVLLSSPSRKLLLPAPLHLHASKASEVVKRRQID